MIKPIVIGVLVIDPIDERRNLDKIGIELGVDIRQKTCLLKSTHMLRKVLHLK